MKSVRLLPVVICAALALLIFKGIGLMTNGGYVLTGPTAVFAQENGAATAADATPVAPSDAVIADTSPTMGDTAPTLAAKVDAPPSGAPSGDPSGSSASAGASMASSAASGSSSSSAPAAAGSPSSSSEAQRTDLCPDTGTSSSAPPPKDQALTDKIGNALASPCAAPVTAVNANGDALPTIKDGNGKIVPLTVVDGSDSEPALLQRLSARRAELDKRESDLDLRTSLVAAAEQKLDERTKALQDLEAKVSALVDEKQAAEDENFKAIVSMYETMKPADAAKIFDTLEMTVLLKVARAMSPRKMSPVLALMNANSAQALTTAFATTDTTATVSGTGGGENLAKLPQIVGH